MFMTDSVGTRKKSTIGNRYSGADPQGWRAVTAMGKNISEGSDKTFDGYKSAKAAADSYTAETGEFANAVRA